MSFKRTMLRLLGLRDHTAKDHLVEARKLIEDKNNWFGGDRPRVKSQPEQTCALLAFNSLGGVCDEKCYGLATTLLTKQCEGQNIIGFNDTHTHAEVLAAFDRAIASA